MEVRGYTFLIWPSGEKFKSVIFGTGQKARAVTFYRENEGEPSQVNFQDLYTVKYQVDQLFGFRVGTPQPEFLHIWDTLKRNRAVFTEKASPPVGRNFPCLVNYCDSFLLVCGGAKSAPGWKGRYG